MKKLIFLLAIFLVGFCSVTTSEAKSNHKHYHYNKVYKHKKVKITKKKINMQIVRNVTITLSSNYDESNTASFFANDRNRYLNKKENENNNNRLTRNADPIPFRVGSDLIRKASLYIGSNARQLGLPARLWCADFMNMLLGGHDRRAFSYINRGAKAQYGCTNCVAVTTRKGGGHVGVVKGYDSRGNPIIISGNHNRRVGIGVYARNRVIAYRYI